MERIQALASEREDMIKEVEREKSERMTAQVCLNLVDMYVYVCVYI